MKPSVHIDNPLGHILHRIYQFEEQGGNGSPGPAQLPQMLILREQGCGFREIGSCPGTNHNAVARALNRVPTL